MACVFLEEMQWIKTRPVHAADFFHGTLELIEAGVSVIITEGEDDSRPLTERVKNFVPKFTDVHVTVDTKDYDLPGISEDTRKLFPQSSYLLSLNELVLF